VRREVLPVASMMRLTLVISSMSTGGAERSMAYLANAWAAKGWSISLLTLDSAPSFYSLDPRIRYRPLGIAGQSPSVFAATANNLRRLRILRRAIRAEQPAAAVSFMDTTNVLTLLAIQGLGLPVIVSEWVDPAQQPIGGCWALLRRWLYPRATRFIVQTQRNLEYYPSSIQRIARVIPNALIVPKEAQRYVPQHPPGRSKVVIAMGRLVEQKGFDMLLRAFGRIAAKHPDWILNLWGEGEKRAELESLIAKLGLQPRAQLCGLTRQPFERFLEADLFVLSSRYEGLPNVLCEAMACGLPVISFDCPTGPREIIRDGLDGTLVPEGDVDALAAAMDRLMGDESERKRLSTRAVEVRERFDIEKVVGMWEQALGEATLAREQ
jgi:glycosyltransferase involved in cell wall biosynthesis